MNADIFSIDHRLAEFDGDNDVLIIEDADGNEIDALYIVPSDDRAPYDAALAAAGFIAVGDNQARRA